MMKAAVYKKYGPAEVLKIKEIPKPFPGPEEILVKVYATTVAYGDVSVRKNLPLREFNMPFLLWIIARLTIGLKKPKKQIPGSEFAGVVEAIGKDVKHFRTGDPVFGYTGPNFGASAEFLCISEKTKPASFAANTLVEKKPENLTYEQAAAIPYGTITAFNLLKKANLSKDKNILINGASGNIGSAAVRIAKYYYGAQVIGVCNTDGQEFVKSIGADKVIDYSREDFTKNGE